MKTSVECYSGVEYAERPTALMWEGQRLAIEEIERRWREPGGPAFRVRTKDGRRFQLRYDEQDNTWTIHALSPGVSLFMG